MHIARAAVAAAILALPTELSAQRVRVEHGNVIYQPARGAQRVVTRGGKDSAAVLSPDGRRAAVVRYTGRTVETAQGPDAATELWLVDVASGAGRRLVLSADSHSPERSLARFSDPAFSPDGRKVYFLSNTAWVTSGAVHVVDVATGRERYLMPGNSLAVVPRGGYRGDLMVGQHRYFLAEGSYDWVWLMTPQGRQIGPIGETDEQMEEFRRTFIDRHESKH